jgi:hypothetical protein
VIIGTNCIGTCKLSYINAQYDQDYGEPPSPAQLRSKLVHNLKTFNNSLHGVVGKENLSINTSGQSRFEIL